MNTLTNSELKVSDNIQILGHYDDETLLTKSSDLIKTIKFDGFDFYTKSDDEIQTQINKLTAVINSIACESICVYTHLINREEMPLAKEAIENNYAKRLNDDLQTLRDAKRYRASFYITIIYRTPTLKLNFFNKLLAPASSLVESNRSNMLHSLQELTDIVQRVVNSLSELNPVLLKTYQYDGVKYSALLEFYSRLVNAEDTQVSLEACDYSKRLPRKRIFFGNRLVKFQGAARDQYATIFSIKSYCSNVRAKNLTALLSLPFEFVLTQTFAPQSKFAMLNELQKKQDKLVNASDAAVSQAYEIDDARDRLAAGELVFGKHSLSIQIQSTSYKRLEKHCSRIETLLLDANFNPVREDINMEASFWASMPGNQHLIARNRIVSSENFAALTVMQNYLPGRYESHWGGPITQLEHLNGSKFNFHFHSGQVGNTVVFGKTGSGKTTSVDVLLSESQKKNTRIFFFDYLRGSEAFIRSLGGDYVKIGKDASAFNPLQMNDTLANRRALAALLEILLQDEDAKLSASDSDKCNCAINTIFDNDFEDRSFKELAPSLGESHLLERFAHWHSDGARAHLFGAENDTLEIDNRIFGMDMTEILKDKRALAPVLWYLFARINDVMERNPDEKFIIVLEEGWSLLQDPIFRAQIQEWLVTIRRLGGMVIFMTQHPSHALRYPELSDIIFNSCPTQIYFGDNQAQEALYIDKLKLTEREFEIIATLNAGEHYFLLKQDNQSAVLRINPDAIKKHLPILSGNLNRAKLCEKLIAKYGDAPNQWIDIYLEKSANV